MLAKGAPSAEGGGGERDSKPPKLQIQTHLALPINPIHLSPPRIPPLQLDSRFPQPHPQRIRGFPSMVMRDLAVHMMRYVRLGDPVGERRG
jgi:hypothetical protein